MKKLFLFTLIAAVIFSSCEFILGEHIRGNGNITTEKRTVSFADKIKLAGSYDVELVKGALPSVEIETDANILPYLITGNEDDWLVVKSRHHTNLDPTKKIKIIITTDKVNAVSIAGSGNIYGKDKFSTTGKVEIRIAGSGDVNLDLNAPRVYSDIAGSGNIKLTGETKDQEIRIAGNGDYNCPGLKSENAEVHIAGSGDVRVFADSKLAIHIAGSGNVYYQGNPTIEQHIAGSGQIKKIQ
jgi:hypothetical protein